MHTFNSLNDYLTEVAKVADLVLKPWSHSAINLSNDSVDTIIGETIDLNLRIECRSKEGVRHSENDMDIEIYSSGSELNLILGWSDQKGTPMLWHGKHSVWMDSTTGKRCTEPPLGSHLESLARRLKASLSSL